MIDIALSAGDLERKRKLKEEKRRKTKEERKNKIKDHAVQKNLGGKKTHEQMIEQKRKEYNREQLDMSLIKEMNIAEKLGLIKVISHEIINDPDEKYRKISDLLLFCQDNKDIDVVMKAMSSLAEVFCDILPTYRIRQQNINTTEEGGKHKKVSKEVSQLREQEQSLLNSYKDYLKVLEVFSKTKPEKLIKKQGIQEEKKAKKALDIYRRLREQSITCYCKLLKRHPHFNFRLNILQTILPKVASGDITIRNQCTQTLFELLKKDDNTILDFKLEILKELAKVLKSRPHTKMDPNLLDCLVSHQIVVDEKRAKLIDYSSKKVQDLHQQMEKLRKKGKFNDYRQMKKDLLKEMNESDAIGVDLGKSSHMNNNIIKEILAIYFDVLKNKSNSPLLKGVFLGLPSFTQFVNIEIIWDLINVLREYLKLELDENNEDDANNIKIKSKQASIANVMAGLLCAFQIIDVGAGQAFNVEEKDFIDAMYHVIQRMFENPFNYSFSDYLAFLKCMTIVFLQRRQYSNDLVNAFVKRLAIIQIHLREVEKCGILYLIKQIITKYPTARSALLEMDAEGLNSAFGPSIYRPDINDPQLANASQSSMTLELIHTMTNSKQSDASHKLAKGILFNEAMSQEFLGLHAIEVVKKLMIKLKLTE